MTMKVAVFGATGGTGQQVVAQALAAGHTVQALARTPEKLPAHAGLTVIAGNVLDPQAVARTVAGVDAVICSLGTSANNPPEVVSNGTANIIAAMDASAVRRLVVVTSLGVGDSKNQVPFAFRMIMQTVLRKVMEDKERQERLVRESGLDWVIVRPGGLTDGEATGIYRFGLKRDIMAGQVARADVAGFVLKQLTDDTFLRQAPAIA